jgi:asparagine synthetase B (glutamine-hydrolysing)
MCGIGGIVSKNGKPNREITKLMGDTMIERGPDNLGFSKTGNI